MFNWESTSTELDNILTICNIIDNVFAKSHSKILLSIWEDMFSEGFLSPWGTAVLLWSTEHLQKLWSTW